jgi:ankyrin repeat protein
MDEAEGRLVEAVKAGDRAAVEALLRERPERARLRPGGLSLVMLATYHRHAELVPVLVGAGDERDLFESAATGALDRVQRLVRERPEAVNTHAADGHTPLGLASFFGHADVVRFLLAQGAAPDTASRNEMNVRPLHAAAARGDVAIVKMLLAAGADPNVRQQGGYLPLHEAAHAGKTEIAHALVEAGARADLAEDKGRTSVDLAREGGHAELAEWLARPRRP